MTTTLQLESEAHSRGDPGGRVLKLASSQPADCLDAAALMAVFDAMPEQVALLNADGFLVLANRNWSESQSPMISRASWVTGTGTNYLDYWRSIHAGRSVSAKAVAGMRSVLSGKARNWVIEYRIPVAEGHCWRLLQVVAIPRLAGHALVVESDITAQKRARSRIRTLSHLVLTAQERARQALGNELQDAVTQNIAAIALDLSRSLNKASPAGTDLRGSVGEAVERLRRLCGPAQRSPTLDADAQPARQEAARQASAASPRLSERQREVLRLLAGGATAKEAACALHLSVKTVEYHKYKAMRQLRIVSSAALVRYALQTGLVAT